VRALFTTTLLFSVFFCAVALLLAHEFIIGLISPRGLGVALTALLVASAVGIAVMLKSDWVRKSILESRDVDSGSRRGRVLVIWVARIAVIVLILAFLNGLWHITEKPLAPRLVGLGANLLVTFAIISAIRRMGGGPK
jgi:hypothetical protein